MLTWTVKPVTWLFTSSSVSLAILSLLLSSFGGFNFRLCHVAPIERSGGARHTHTHTHIVILQTWLCQNRRGGRGRGEGEGRGEYPHPSVYPSHIFLLAPVWFILEVKGGGRKGRRRRRRRRRERNAGVRFNSIVLRGTGFGNRSRLHHPYPVNLKKNPQVLHYLTPLPPPPSPSPGWRYLFQKFWGFPHKVSTDSSRCSQAGWSAHRSGSLRILSCSTPLAPLSGNRSEVEVLHASQITRKRDFIFVFLSLFQKEDEPSERKGDPDLGVTFQWPLSWLRACYCAR